MPKRIYLKVPLHDEPLASTCGARWDRRAKAWYVPPGVDLVKSGLARWSHTVQPGVGGDQHASGHGVEAAREHLSAEMAAAGRRAQQHAEHLVTLAHVRERQVQGGLATGADDQWGAGQKNLNMATERLSQVRGEVLDARTADPRTARLPAVATATTTGSNERLHEQVKRERQQVLHAALPDLAWKDLPQSVRQRIIEAVKAGRAVTLPREAPAGLRRAISRIQARRRGRGLGMDGDM